jgi:TonB family protein
MCLLTLRPRRFTIYDGRSLALGLLAWVYQEGSPFPRYPDSLRAAQIDGSVIVQFKTDVSGRADSATFKIVSSTHVLFTDAVVKVLPQWHLSRDTVSAVLRLHDAKQAGDLETGSLWVIGVHHGHAASGKFVFTP